MGIVFGVNYIGRSPPCPVLFFGILNAKGGVEMLL